MENDQIIKIILNYLHENKLDEVKNQLEKESGIKFEENFQDILINFVNTNYSDLYSLNKAFKQILKIENPIIINLINILYFNKLYNNMDNLLPNEILSQIQNIVKELTDLKLVYKEKISLIDSELKKISLIFKDFIQKNKENILKIFPEIESNEKVIEHIKKQYLQQSK